MPLKFNIVLDMGYTSDDYIDYYNNDAGQMDLLKLTPTEYYKYLQTGKYPLPVYTKK